MISIGFSFKAIFKKSDKNSTLHSDQLYSNIRVTTQVTKSQHESTRINTSLKQV